MRHWFYLLLLLSSSVSAQLDIQTWRTPEGAKVLFVQTQDLPMLDVALNFDAASSRDGDHHGLATLTNALIGTQTLYQNEEQIIQAFESVGAEFERYSLKDMSIVSLRTLTRSEILRHAVATLAEVISKPKFTQAHLTREKKQTLRSLEAIEQSPAKIGALAFAQAVFGEHPYAHSRIGDVQTLAKIGLAEVQTHYRRYYSAKNLTIAMVGGVSVAKAKQIARQLSHGLNSGQKPKNHPMVKALDKSHAQHIEFPSTQTHLLIGQVGMNRSHPDYHAFYLGNHLLGGSGLNSLLSQEIRESKGLAYSVSSYFAKMRSYGYFAIDLQTQNAQTQQAKTLVLETLERFLTQPIDVQQFQDAKDNIIGGFALETASNANILTYLSLIGFYDLPLDYLDRFIDKIEVLDAQQVQAAFNRLIDLDRLVVLSVGRSN